MIPLNFNIQKMTFVYSTENKTKKTTGSLAESEAVEKTGSMYLDTSLKNTSAREPQPYLQKGGINGE